ncbi:UNVERIFIED_CONTAM: hypothetical protein K2H54_055298 [Gekko kuhli]
MTRHRPGSNSVSQETNVVGMLDGSGRMEPLQDLSEIRQPKRLDVAVLPASQLHPSYLLEILGQAKIFNMPPFRRDLVAQRAHLYLSVAEQAEH